MKDFLKLVKENNDSKNFKVECIIEVELNIKHSDITGAGEEATSELDLIESELTDLGYKVTKTEMKEIEEEAISESVDKKEILNKTADEELEQDIVDIFNVVESRLNKINSNYREKAFEMLKYKLTSFNINENLSFSKDYILTEEDANKLYQIEEDNDISADLTENDYKEFLTNVIGKTLMEYCIWRYPEEPQIQYNLALEYLQ